MQLRTMALGGALLGSIGIGACGGPAPTPAPTMTERPSPTPVPGPTLAPRVTLGLMALNLEFSTRALEVPANTAFMIRFRNADIVGLPHDVDIRRADGTTARDQDPIDGQAEADYIFAALPPGLYEFICSVHPIPGMTGTIRVR
jgi:plastocyanin